VVRAGVREADNSVSGVDGHQPRQPRTRLHPSQHLASRGRHFLERRRRALDVPGVDLGDPLGIAAASGPDGVVGRRLHASMVAAEPPG
jgi:hypothetical protein